MEKFYTFKGRVWGDRALRMGCQCTFQAPVQHSFMGSRAVSTEARQIEHKVALKEMDPT